MPHYFFERLSGQDATFLAGETPCGHLHVSSVGIYELSPLRRPDGGVDFDAIRRMIASLLHRIPRYRQKIQWTPVFGRPVWVDDREFDLDYHIRHTSLPRPGSDRQLKELAARIMSLPLDLAMPPWELWVVEGLEGDRFATITKIHHCMIDGSSGVDLGMILMSTSPSTDIPSAPRFLPRPAPTAHELFREELRHWAGLPLRAVRGIEQLRQESRDLSDEIVVRAKALGGLLGIVIRGASESPINGEIGPHRRFDWLEMSFDDVRGLRREVGCTVNDIVLATVTGAVRRYFQHRGVDPAKLDFRVSAPVSMRREDERGRLGNHVSSWVLTLPLSETDPLRRLAMLHDCTTDLKESRNALGIELMMQVAEWTPPVLLSLGARAAAAGIHSIVTNVPGPQFPLYLLGARMLALYPMVPLFDEMGLGIALFSYDGRLFWGFNADYDLVPDLEILPGMVKEAFSEISAAARSSPQRSLVASRSRPRRNRTSTKAFPGPHPPAQT